MKYIITIIGLALHICVTAQATLTVELSADTIGLEDAVKITYKLSGSQEQIEVLPWEGLQQVAGPNVSSSFSFVNGVGSQEYSQSYILVPTHEGSIYVPSASVIINGEVLETDPIELFIVADPTYKSKNNTTRQSQSIKKKSTNQLENTDEEEYQRLVKKRALAKKKKKF